MGKARKITSLLEEKQKIEKEIEKLQKECRHSAKSIKSLQENVDSTTFIIRWVCDNCKYVVGIPNPEELNKYLNNG